MTFGKGFAGAWEAKSVQDQKVDLNSLTIKKGDPGTVCVYQCASSGGGSNITNKPSGVTGNFILYVESIRKLISLTASVFVALTQIVNLHVIATVVRGRHGVKRLLAA